jgi:hypothetical protein
MDDFTFRYRLKLAPRSSVNAPETQVVLRIHGPHHVDLASLDQKPLSETHDLVLRASGWSTSDEAEAEGCAHRDWLTIALVRHRIGTYPADVAPKGTFFNIFLRSLEKDIGAPVLNDSFGLTVFHSEPAPRFASMGGATIIMGVTADKLRETFESLCDRPAVLTSRERLAIDLFNTSFLESSSATRLLTLVMAIESLLELQPRSPGVVALIESFLATVSTTELIPSSERNSLAGSLGYLRFESISAAGRAFVSNRLGGRRYLEMSAAEFFTECYDARSRLVHGRNPPDYKKIGRLAATLEVFVSDLLTQRYFGGGAT